MGLYCVEELTIQKKKTVFLMGWGRKIMEKIHQKSYTLQNCTLDYLFSGIIKS